MLCATIVQAQETNKAIPGAHRGNQHSPNCVGVREGIPGWLCHIKQHNLIRPQTLDNELIRTIYKPTFLLLFPPLLLLFLRKTNYREWTYYLGIRFNDRDRQTLAAQKTACQFRHASRDLLCSKFRLLVGFIFVAICICKSLPNYLCHCHQCIKSFACTQFQFSSLSYVTRHDDRSLNPTLFVPHGHSTYIQ